MIVEEILARKSNNILSTVRPDASLAKAAGRMCEERIGALLVCNAKNEPVGIITERDILTQAGTNPSGFLECTVADLMTTSLICGLPSDNANYVIHVMRQNRIRHLPIVDGKKVIGMISIRDVVSCVLEESRVENRKLYDYLEMSGQL